jgi:protein-S-isoprenylcysteine O-methyltransferase Ste14
MSGGRAAEVPAEVPVEVPAPFRVMRRINDFISRDFPGGPRFIKAAWVINLQKGGTAPFVLALMVLYDNWSVPAFVYLGLHGSYGLLWLLKHATFPDPGWEFRTTIGGAINMWLFALGLYWIAPVLLISDILGFDRPDPPGWLVAVCIAMYAIGAVLMMGSDAQKYHVLRARKGLITDGFFARIRHPNYLGEMLIYASFALLVRHWAPWAVLAYIWIQLFATNIAHKEVSMARHAGWANYKARTGLLLPRLWARRR